MVVRGFDIGVELMVNTITVMNVNICGVTYKHISYLMTDGDFSVLFGHRKQPFRIFHRGSFVCSSCFTLLSLHSIYFAFFNS